MARSNSARKRILLASSAVLMAWQASPALAQDVPDDAAPGGDIVVTGSRIARPNVESNSPIAVVTGEQTVARGDITLDTYLNTLPQVNPGGTTTSNNPGNGGQSNIDLRGLGPNRNLVLIDGRRPMVSAANQTVDLNTIPQQLIQRIEVITGGAGATYGADAIAGVVNIRLKDDFEGLDLRASYANSVPEMDAREYQLSGVFGGNFADGRGNIAVAVEYANRQGLVKSQRPFSTFGTSTTTTPPMGRYNDAQNAPSQAAINALFTGYGVAAKDLPAAGGGTIHFNNDGSLFGSGTFNNPRDVANYRGTIDASVNTNFFPDFYSYNFDSINILVLPLERKSAFLTGHYEITPGIEFFTQAGYTEYSSATALAPTPIGTTIEATSNPTQAARAKSIYVTPGRTVTGLVVPVTNPFIPNDLRTLLNSRTGDDARLVGSGATEAFLLNKRLIDDGLRQSNFTNQVIQGLVGLRGDISPSWRYEAYYSWGRTTIDNVFTGGLDVQKLTDLLASPTGGANLCAGGFNPFGVNPLSQACVDFVSVVAESRTQFTQNIVQAYVNGDLAELPGGTLSVVLGAEQRRFLYTFDPGALNGPLAGPNTANPDHGTNKFTDVFGELFVPLLKGRPWAESLDLTLGYRRSSSDFNDIQNGVDGKPVSSDSYKVELSYAPIPELRFRGTYQRAVRAPNFGELFSAGGGFPQYFDPCSITSNFRTTSGAAGTALCTNTGLGAAATSYVQTPGTQVLVGFAGNTALKPEKADTFTAGGVFTKWGITASVDYYNMSIEDPVFGPDPNLLIAACYGYHGQNPTLSATNAFCQTIAQRAPDITFLGIPAALGGDANSNFISVNQGHVQTSGIDIQLGYHLPTEWLGEGSALDLNLMVNHVFEFKSEELPGVTLDYVGTASYFGEALGSSFPKWRGTLDAALAIKPFTISTRVRYIDAMTNRAGVQFPGETSFTGPGSVWYFDFGLTTQIDQMTWRVGVNNAFDRQPPQYAPNVQSGTDPSTYDVVGRRAYVQIGLKF
ncbi:MAG: TonB-dependent receptor [Pseudomonadota bacterium]